LTRSLRRRLCLGVAALGAALLLVGCALVPSAAERRASADAFAAARGWRELTLRAGAFELAAWEPAPAPRADLLWVYIEGDGLAWLAPDQASTDPTPVHPLALQLALAQPEGAVAYLARPGQFVGAADCDMRYWTSARFAPEVVDALSDALDQLERRSGARRLVLVGYSGGGALAALLAERRADVRALVSVAGNLDPGAWVALHGLTPLDASLDPLQAPGRLRELPQWHFVGAQDANVTPALVRGFAARMARARVEVVPGFDHACCWAAQWSRLWLHLGSQFGPGIDPAGRGG
jgi:dienelactone hydrolase